MTNTVHPHEQRSGGSLGRGDVAWAQHRTFPSPWLMLIEEPEKLSVVRRQFNPHSKAFYTGWETFTMSLRHRRPDGTRMLRVWANRKPHEGNWHAHDITAKLVNGGRLNGCTTDELTAIWDATTRLYARTGVPIPETVAWVGARDVPAALTLLAYPIFEARIRRRKRRKLTPLHELPPEIRSAVRTRTADAFAVALFGTRHRRRDVIREAVGAPVEALAIAVRLAHLIPSDWIAEYLRTATQHAATARPQQSPAFSWRHDRAALPAIFDQIPPARRRTLLLGLVADARIAVDACRVHQELGPARRTDISGCRNWTQIHDALVDAAVLIPDVAYAVGVNPDRPIPTHPFADALDEQHTSTGLQLIAAGRTGQLRDWGKQMHNCIGSYSDLARAHEVVLFGITDTTGRLVGNLSIGADGQIWECLGKYNKRLPTADDKAIRALIRAHLNHTELPATRRAA